MQILADCSSVETLSAKAIDLFALPGKLYFENNANRDTRMALIVNRQDQTTEALHLFETASVTRGWVARVFEERQTAMDWLQKQAALNLR